jgi:nucleoside-diphosphate-sugar epimerase
MRKVFVTGITGKSGLYLLDEIVNANNSEYQYTFLIRSEDKARQVKEKYPQAQVCLGSYNDGALLDAEFSKGYDILLHIAGVQSTLKLLKPAISGGVKWLILVHTTGIYSKDKAAGELYRQIESEIDKQLQGKGVAKTILRPTMIYGNINDKNVAVFMKMVYKLRLFPVVNHANYELQPVWCGDLGKAYYQVLTHPDTTKNKDYNLSGGKPILLIEMFKIMASKLGVKNTYINCPFGLAYSGAWFIFAISFGKIDFREKVQRLVEPRVYSHKEATQDFGYNPVPFEVGIDEEIEEFKQSLI